VTLLRRALAEVCTVPVLLVFSEFRVVLENGIQHGGAVPLKVHHAEAAELFTCDSQTEEDRRCIVRLADVFTVLSYKVSFKLIYRVQCTA